VGSSGLVGTAGASITSAVTGVFAVGRTGLIVPVYWKVIDDSQTANWVVINASTATSWGTINNSQTTDWIVIGTGN
jgi:hypothetical protein